jgi:hypothetical protein
MPTTPISVSTGIQGLTNTTLYTVPVGKTAICKAVVGQGANDGSYGFTISKYTNGQNYPLNYNQYSYQTPATGGTQIKGANLITAPITLGAGDEIRAYIATDSAYNLPNVSTTSILAADGSTATLNAILFANGIYMVVGSCTTGAFVATSTDAITWTQKTGALAFAGSWNRIDCNGSIWVAWYTGNSQGTVYYSSDNGVTWLPATIVSGSINIQEVVNNGTTFLAYGTNNRIYSSTNGSTWTQSTAYYTTVGNTSTVIHNIGWSGSHWIVENDYGNLASVDLTTWFGYTGVSFGNSISTVYYTTYSSAYSKYYTTRANSSTPNIHSSPNGLLWTNLASATTPVYKVCCAGSNTVLLAPAGTGSATRWRSTDGATFASATDVNGYVGPLYGLENGYFLQFANDSTNNACNLSTDPTVSTGTAAGSTQAGFISTGAAADPSSGKWIGIGYVSGNNWFFIGGTSGTNIGTNYNTALTTGSNGTPTSVTWSAVDGYFYIISSTGLVYRCTSYNSGVTQVGTSGVGSSNANSIKTVGTTLYVVGSANVNTVYTSSVYTGGATWGSFSYSGISYNYIGSVIRGWGYWGEALATNGTDLVWCNQSGSSYAITPSVSTSAMRMPQPVGCGTVQTVNSNTFMYGGYVPSTGGEPQGYFTSTNVITTYGQFVYMSGYTLQSYPNPANKIAYIGGNYYATSTGGNTWTGSSITNVPSNRATNGSTIAGNTVVNPTYGWSGNTSYLVSIPGGTTLANICKTNTPSSYLYAATVTASIVEIS